MIISQVAKLASLNHASIKEASKTMLHFAKEFDKKYANLKNLRNLYNEEFKNLS